LALLLPVLALLVFTGTALASLSFLLKWGGSGTADGQFITPNGIAVDGTGNVYVAEGNGNRVQKFDANGNFLLKFGIPGDVPGGFVSPSGVTVDSSGNIYVTDSFTDRVSKFNAAGVFQLTWGTHGSGAGQFLGASGVATDSAGNVFVSETNNHRVQKFTSTGVFVSSFGSNGSGDGQFNGPEDVAIDSADNIYVADTGNNRIQKFTPAGVFLTKWGTAGSADGQFSIPFGVGESAGTVYVADTGNNRIQSFTNTGTFIESFGSAGSGDGQFAGPQDVAGFPIGIAYVADTSNDRVQKLGDAPAVVADAGPDQTVECSGAATNVTLDGTGSSGSGTLTYTWKEGMTVLGSGATLVVSLPLGSHTITLTVTSSGGGSDDDTVNINVVDTQGPAITLLGANPLTVECHTGFIDPGASASDTCAGDLTGAISVSGSVDPNTPGSYVLTYSVSDGSHTASVMRTVNVVDTTAPVITLNGQSPSLWPPDHTYHTFEVTDFVTSASDSCGTGLSISDVFISQVTSDELENSGGDGNTGNDIVIAAGCRSVQLRAERDGGGNGRVYTITFKVRDATGNTTTATAQVTVPKSQDTGGAAVDSGPQYTVTSACP
jgi:streptogramin lyase